MVLNRPVWPQRWRALQVLAAVSPLTSLDLARALGVADNHASVLLCGLLRQRYVQPAPLSARQRHAHAGLRRAWTLAPAGVVAAAYPLRAWRPAGHLSALGDEVATVLREPALRSMNGGAVRGAA